MKDKEDTTDGRVPFPVVANRSTFVLGSLNTFDDADDMVTLLQGAAWAVTTVLEVVAALTRSSRLEEPLFRVTPETTLGPAFAAEKEVSIMVASYSRSSPSPARRAPCLGSSLGATAPSLDVDAMAVVEVDGGFVWMMGPRPWKAPKGVANRTCEDAAASNGLRDDALEAMVRDATGRTEEVDVGTGVRAARPGPASGAKGYWPAYLKVERFWLDAAGETEPSVPMGP